MLNSLGIVQEGSDFTRLGVLLLRFLLGWLPRFRLFRRPVNWVFFHLAGRLKNRAGLTWVQKHVFAPASYLADFFIVVLDRLFGIGIWLLVALFRSVPSCLLVTAFLLGFSCFVGCDCCLCRLLGLQRARAWLTRPLVQQRISQPGMLLAATFQSVIPDECPRSQILSARCRRLLRTRSCGRAKRVTCALLALPSPRVLPAWDWT